MGHGGLPPSLPHLDCEHGNVAARCLIERHGSPCSSGGGSGVCDGDAHREAVPAPHDDVRAGQRPRLRSIGLCSGLCDGSGEPRCVEARDVAGADRGRGREGGQSRGPRRQGPVRRDRHAALHRCRHDADDLGESGWGRVAQQGVTEIS